MDIFEPRTMLDAIEEMHPPTLFLRDTFFPQAEPADTEHLDVDIVKGSRTMAPFVHPLAEGRMVEGEGFETKSIKPGYIKPKMVTTAGDALKRQAGEVIYAGGKSPAERAAAKLGKDLAKLMADIDRREEWMAAKIMDSGTVTMTIKAESGEQLRTVDFLMDANHKITLGLGDRWNEETSDPIADLTAWSVLCRKDSGINPTEVIMGGDAVAAFLRHPGVQKFMDLRRVDMGQIDPRQLPNGVSYVGRLNAPSLTVDIWTYDAWYKDDATGTLTSMVPTKKVWMGSRATANRTLYAVIQDIEAIEGGQAAVRRFAKSWVTKDPGARWLMVQSAPLVAMLQPGAFVSAEVLA